MITCGATDSRILKFLNSAAEGDGSDIGLAALPADWVDFGTAPLPVPEVGQLMATAAAAATDRCSAAVGGEADIGV